VNRQYSCKVAGKAEGYESEIVVEGKAARPDMLRRTGGKVGWSGGCINRGAELLQAK